MAITLSSELKKVHAYMLENQLDVTKLMKIIVRSSSNGDGVVGDVDYKTLNVTFPKKIDSDIVLDVFVNRLMFDAVSTDMANDVFFSNEYALTPIEVTAPDPDDETKTIKQKIRVYKFASEEEMKSDDIDKMLRIKTLYGIGYVGLVPEGNKNASDYKICVGYNIYNNPIIRCLEKTS